jgi:4-hydroxybenzoyl-CoA thioesterase
MFRFERPIRFAEVDAAKIVFFARYLDFCHDAIEAMFSELPGGYAEMIVNRDIGVPSVHLEVNYRAPLRYGDVAIIDTVVERIGTRSITLMHTFTRKIDGVLSATVRQVVVTTQLQAMESVDVPADVRALLTRK